MFVAASGEKAALKLVPRTRRIGGDVVRVALAIGAVPLVCALLVVAGGYAAGPRTLLLLTAVLWSTSIGLLQVLAGLHRLRGAPTYDPAAFLAVAVAVVATTLLTVRYGWSPRRQLTVVSLAALGVCVVMLLRLPSGWLRPARPARRGIAVRVLRTALLLGLPELLGSASVAVCYLALRRTHAHRSDRRMARPPASTATAASPVPGTRSRPRDPPPRRVPDRLGCQRFPRSNGPRRCAAAPR
jgi:hypothetical protein